MSATTTPPTPAPAPAAPPAPPPAAPPSAAPQAAKPATPAPAPAVAPAPAAAPVKPVTSPAPAVTPVKPVAPAAGTSREVNIINELLGQYKTFLSAKIGTTKGFQAAAKTLANVVARVLQTPTQDVMMAVWTFFVDNANGVCVESVALQGVDALDAQTRQRTEIVYTLFRLAGTGKDVGSSAQVKTELVQSRLKCPQLILFLQQQAQLVTNKKAAAKLAK